MNKAYKYRLYPDKKQSELINKTFGCVRFVYNRMLADRNEKYKQNKDDKEVLKKLKYTTPADYKNEFVWLKEVDSLALANAQLNLNTAYKNFFRDKSIGFPKFKSKHNDRRSYTTNNQKGTIRIIDNRHIRIPKLKDVKIKLHRQIPSDYDIKSATISQTASGKYYISILVEFDADIQSVLPCAENVIGLDYSSKALYIDNFGTSADYPKYYRKMESKLKREQRKLSKRMKGGKNRDKQRQKVAKLHEKAANQRKDFLHKQSRQIANAYDAVVIEDLNMRGMAQGLKLAKSTNDNGFGMLRTFLEYKLREQGKELVVIDKWYPSSKTCHICGEINNKLTLADRVWTCICGTVHDRDINAAINIRNEGCYMLGIA
ncbi:MAG: RNA-guided endonuclease TnpB family protein [Clostridiaceae bacterium]